MCRFAHKKEIKLVSFQEQITHGGAGDLLGFCPQNFLLPAVRCEILAHFGSHVTTKLTQNAMRLLSARVLLYCSRLVTLLYFKGHRFSLKSIEKLVKCRQKHRSLSDNFLNRMAT